MIASSPAVQSSVQSNVRVLRPVQLLQHATFNDARARFYAAEITLALGYLHDNHIIYRDLKVVSNRHLLSSLSTLRFLKQSSVPKLTIYKAFHSNRFCLELI